jgi:hypothetical protein
MAKGRGDVWILREVLEKDMSPANVSAVLFEALSSHGSDVPNTPEALRQLADESLKPALEKRLDAAKVEALMKKVHAALEEDDGAPEISIGQTSSAPPPSGREADATRAVPTTTTPVPVLVVAGSDAFERRLASALGPARVAPATAGTVHDIKRFRNSAIVLVDATSFPPIEPVDLADELAGLPETTAKVIWGADLPYGRSVSSAIEPIGTHVVRITRADGIDPLLDLIRSRRRKS